MSFRTIVITNKANLNYKNRFLVVKQELEEKYIHLSEIDTIIVDSISVSISTYLLKELKENKINIIFCDEKHNPFGELTTFYSSHNSSKKILEQSQFSNKDKDELWMKIIKNKIINQSILLNLIKSDNFNLLIDYSNDVKLGDKTNREGHASKVYFNSLFGKQFIRHNSDSINYALNYGYSVLLSMFNKEIINYGCITQLGIHHKNEFNEFNLSCDLMEPFRVIIDDFVYKNKDLEFNKEYKLQIVNLFNDKFKYKNKNYTLKDIIKMYVGDTLNSIIEHKEYVNFIYER